MSDFRPSAVARRCWSGLLGAVLALGPVQAGTPATAKAERDAVASHRGEARYEAAGSARSAALPLDCTGERIYALQNGAGASDFGTLLALDTSTLAGPTPTVTTTMVSKIPQGGMTNALGILPGGTGAYVVDRTGGASSIVVHGYDADSDTWTAYAGTTPGNGVVVVAGAIDPSSGIYYYAALNPASAPGKAKVYGFDTTTHTAIPGVIATFDLPTSSTAGANGDIAFDAAGNLYIVTSANGVNDAAIGIVDGPLPTTGSATGAALPMRELAQINNPQQRQYNGIAFDNQGKLFIEYSTVTPSAVTFLQAVNPNNGQLIGQPKRLSDQAFVSVDLGACSTNPTLTLAKNIVGRFMESTTSNDQFELSITGGGIREGNTATTTGNTTGVQPVEAGPVVGVANTTYTLTEHAVSGGNLANYTTTYACVDTANGDAPVSSGAATSFTLHFPATTAGGNSPRILCTFTNTPDAPAPAVSLVKSAAPQQVTAAGQLVTYTHTVRNTGNVTLSGVTVSETAFSGSGGDPVVSCPDTTLAPGAAMDCVATYAVTQTDMDTGELENTATVTGTPPSGPAVTATDDATLTADQSPLLSLVKTVVGDGGVFRAGEVLTYSYLVTNTGNVTVTDVSASDTAFSGTGTPPVISCPPGALLPGESLTCMATYTVTNEDVVAGEITNTATATGTPPSGQAVTSNESSAVFTPARRPEVRLTKAASPNEVTESGQRVDYTLVVSNTGNLPLDDVDVADTVFSGSGAPPTVSCPATSLAVGDSMTCTASYLVTQTDVDSGSVANTAVATGTPPDGPAVTSTANATVTAQRNPSLALAKSAEPQSVTAADQLVTYTHTVTNTGNVTLTGVAVTEIAFSGTGTTPAVSCPGTSLAPGQSMDCTATYEVTQADVNAGEVANTARAAGNPPSGASVTATSSASVTADQAPAVALVKTVVGDGGVFRSGEVLTYSYRVTNTGNVTLSALSVADVVFSGTGPAPEPSCPVTVLAPGASTTCTATYTVTQQDVDAGSVENTARAAGTPPSGTPVSVQSSALFTPVTNPALSLAKTAGPVTVTAVGQVVSYDFVVTNTGNVTLSGLAVNETDFSGTGPAPQASCPSIALAPGVSITCTAAYAVTQADFDAGTITNTVLATARPPTGPPVVTAPSTAVVTAEQNPGITVVKTASPTAVSAAGQQIDYILLVTNTGDVTLTDVRVDETAFTGTGPEPNVTCPPGSLAPGQSKTCTATYTVTQADMDAAAVTNGVIATGTPPAGPDVTGTTEETVTVLLVPELSLVKTVVGDGGVFRAGEVLTYSYLVTNTGNVTVSDVSTVDVSFSGTGTAPVISCPAGPLAPGESLTCTATYTVTAEDVAAGEITNTAVASGTAVSGEGVESNESSAVFTPQRNPELRLVKSAAPSVVTEAGQRVDYSFLVTNTGNLTLNAVSVAETEFSGSGTAPAVSCPETSLAVGESMTCTASYAVTQTDMNEGAVTNTALATGTPPDGPAVTATSSEAVTAQQQPALTLRKSVTPGSVSSAGQRVDYRFAVTNTGNVTLTQVGVVEPSFTGSGTAPAVSCPAATLVPGASMTCTASYTVTQADIAAGAVTNGATAFGTPPTGPPVTSTSGTTFIATVVPLATLTLAKSAFPASVSAAGQRVDYRFVVTNTGTVGLSQVRVNETAFTGSGTPPVVSCPLTTLGPGASMTCTAMYTVVQADLSRGSVNNTATATGTPPDGPAVTATSSATVSASGGPASGLSLVKEASPTKATRPGQRVEYRLTVTNTGSVPLSEVSVSEDRFTGTGPAPTVSCPRSALDPGESMVCRAAYTVTRGDIGAGAVRNTATVTGRGPDGASVRDTSSAAVSTSGHGGGGHRPSRPGKPSRPTKPSRPGKPSHPARPSKPGHGHGQPWALV
ncbi:hypothetical protein [Streptomyces sp. NPDC127084]|uniref:DUF7507 domain-containing protein n=1 Tax=Streptomyces sp. NPDC127084 TaxID=3347133 RepID=UPI00365C9824